MCVIGPVIILERQGAMGLKSITWFRQHISTKLHSAVTTKTKERVNIESIKEKNIYGERIPFRKQKYKAWECGNHCFLKLGRQQLLLYMIIDVNKTEDTTESNPDCQQEFCHSYFLQQNRKH